MILLKVGPGEKVSESVNKQLRELSIDTGAIVSIIGAVATCTISNMHHDNESIDMVTTIDQPLELSGTGEIVDGTPHIHVVMSGEGNLAVGGHLHDAVVGRFFVHLYVIPDVQIER